MPFRILLYFTLRVQLTLTFSYSSFSVCSGQLKLASACQPGEQHSFVVMKTTITRIVPQLPRLLFPKPREIFQWGTSHPPDTPCFCWLIGVTAKDRCSVCVTVGLQMYVYVLDCISSLCIFLRVIWLFKL